MDSDLYNAAAEGNTEKLRKFDQSELTQVTCQENTVLHVAVQVASAREKPYESAGKIELIQAICNLCPSLIRQANWDGDTPLHIAARGGRDDIVELLISKFEDVEIGSLLKMVNSKKDTALHGALKNHHLFDGQYQKEYLKVVQMLIHKDAQLSNFINDAGESPVFIAAREGLHDFLDAVLMNSCCSEYGGPGKMTALHAAVLLREEDIIIEKLMARKPDLINEEDEFGRTPLHYAANLHSDKKVQKLLQYLACDHKSVVYHSDKNGRTALHYAALRGNINSICALFQCCPDCFEQVEKSGWTTLHFAVKGSSFTLMSIIKNEKLRSISMAMVNKSDKNGDTPLHLAAKISNIVALEFLMEIPQVDKRALNIDNLTALDILEASHDIQEKASLINNLKNKTGAISSQAPKIAEKDSLQGGEKATQHDQEVEKWSNNIQDPTNEDQVDINEDKVRQLQLLVATLIATVSFAATFTMPGGYNNDGPEQGMANFSANAAFQAFVISNTLAMAPSTTAIFVHFNAATYNIFFFTTDHAGRFILLSNTGMVIAFVSGTYLVVANNRPLAISTTIIGHSLFLVVGGRVLYHFFKLIFCRLICFF